MLHYIDREGQEVTQKEWAALFARPAYRQVERVEVGSARVEAAWVGIQSDLETCQSLYIVEAVGWKTADARKKGGAPHGRGGRPEVGRHGARRDPAAEEDRPRPGPAVGGGR